jgi:hypothetical protein
MKTHLNRLKRSPEVNVRLLPSQLLMQNMRAILLRAGKGREKQKERISQLGHMMA